MIRSRGSRWPACTLELHPVELREDVVGEIERPVGEDVDLASAQDAKGRELLVRGGDLLALAPDVVGVESGYDSYGARVVADRDVLVTEVSGRQAELENRGASVRPGGVTVEIAADLGELDERRRGTAEGFLAQFGRTPRHAP